MNSSLIEDILRDLIEHQKLSREILSLVEMECQALRDPEGRGTFEFLDAKRAALVRLNGLKQRIHQHRIQWQRFSPAERRAASEVTALLQQNQDLIMRIVVLDRENEQALLRKGLIPPRHLPPANRQRPHFVADLYRRQAANTGHAEAIPEDPLKSFKMTSRKHRELHTPASSDADPAAAATSSRRGQS